MTIKVDSLYNRLLTNRLVQLAGAFMSFNFLRIFDAGAARYSHSKSYTENKGSIARLRGCLTHIFQKAFFAKFHTRLILVKLLPPEKSELLPHPREKG
jgi:hypothetical protein